VRHIVPISGKDSLATALLLKDKEPREYEFVYNDTRMELPETYEWLNRVEASICQEIHRCGRDLGAIIEQQGMLPGPQVRFCTRLSKIAPMHDYVGETDATLYIGLRADEDREGHRATKRIQVRYPLREYGLGLDGVFALCKSAGLMPPEFFWQRLYDAVRDELGTAHWVIDVMPEHIKHRVFAWRTRPNCFMCFYQRKSEWVGLLEFHPELFARAEKMEIETGGAGRREAAFYWIDAEWPLSRVRAEAQAIFGRQVAKLAKMFRQRLQAQFWQDATEDAIDQAATSCGLFCGK
jgi:hypothetical protein